MHPAAPGPRRRQAGVAGRGGPRAGGGHRALAERLLADGVELVVMESTIGLLADLVLPAGGRRPYRAAGELAPVPAAGGPPKTGWTRSGSPGWRRWACSARVSCRRRRSGRCGT